jgi:glycosyltransferase involved in cell wall biosynthesis
VKRRVLFVGRSRYRLPLPGWLAKKWDAVEQELDYRVLGAAEKGSATEAPRFRLRAPAAVGMLDAPLFYLRLPFEVRREIHAFEPAAVVAADPYVGAATWLGRALSGRRPRLIVEVHGDPRTFTRLYGSPARKALSQVADAVARWTLRRADATRALSNFTSSIVEQARGETATAVFPTYSDLSAFSEPLAKPVPEEHAVVFVGALEPYKNVVGLAAAWRRVARELPEAKLVVIGKGSQQRVIDDLLRELPGQVEHRVGLPPDGVALAFDETRALVLPSWPEGLGRVVIEAFARGRGVVATEAGGIVDLVDDGEQGLLIPPGDTDALVAALRRVLTEDGLAERLGAAARERYAEWHSTPADFARAYRELVERACT